MPTLIIFAREPLPGRCKTRLCPPLSPAQAAGLYGCFLADLIDTAIGLPALRLVLAYSPASSPAFFAAGWPGLPLREQRGASLGARMDNALQDALAADGPAVLIGSDFPQLPAGHIVRAFALLAAGADLALGPADDGGYYLVGLRAPQPRLLREVPMSTPTVLADTLALAGELGLRAELAPPCYDVDTAADLARLAADLALAPPAVAPRTRRFLYDVLGWKGASRPE